LGLNFNATVVTSFGLAFDICFSGLTSGLAASLPAGAQPAARTSEQTTALTSHFKVLTCLIVGLLRNFVFMPNRDPVNQEPVQTVIICFVLPKATDFSLYVFN
jgi:hypothetical protein